MLSAFTAGGRTRRARRAAWLILAVQVALTGCGDGTGYGAAGDAAEDGVFAEVEQAAVVCADGEVLQGIDVSYYQGQVDWPAVAADGISFAIARVNHGDFMDPEFGTNWQGIRDNGMIRGAYQYFDPGGDPEVQATTFIDNVGTLEPGDLPGVIDVESTDGLSGPEIAANVQTWVDMVEAGTGRRPIVYTGQYFWNDNVSTDAFSEYPLWLAQYSTGCPNLPTAWSQWMMWQYTSSGSVAGIAGNVDRNEFNGDLLKLNDVAANGYRAAVVSVDYPAEVSTGAVLDVTITLTNLGARDWNATTSLGTTMPRDRDSPFVADDWVSARRVMNVGPVTSGESVELTFQMVAPFQAGVYEEHFNLVQEGVVWFSDDAPAGGPSDDSIRLELAVTGDDAAAGVGSGPSATSGNGGGGAIPNTGASGGCSVGSEAGKAARRRPSGWSMAWLLAMVVGACRRRRKAL